MPQSRAFYASLILISLTSQLGITSPISSTTIEQSVHLDENTPSGSVVADLSDVVDVTAMTSEGKIFQLLNQKLSSTPQVRRKWMKLNEFSGVVSLRHKLDREAVCGALKKCSIELEIFVRPTFRMINLNVIIVDVNEYAPRFPAKYIVVNVSEETPVGDVISLDHFLAKDKDIGNNSDITYILSASNHFSLGQYRDETDSPHLNVEVRRPLDYERKSLYSLTLTAKDAGVPSKSSHVTLQIRVLDENDNAPVFEQQEYSVMLQENLQPGHVIARVQAFDADSGLDGMVRYFLSPQNKVAAKSAVRINENTGEVTLTKMLDREAFVKLIVFIEAKDLGQDESKTARTRLVIYVGDVNDNAPIISVSFIATSLDDTVYIEENSPRDSVIAYISGKDKDLGPNGEVSISVTTYVTDDVTGGENPESLSLDPLETFEMTPDGFLGLNRGLDRETNDKYIVKVKGCDRGVIEQCSCKDITVIVLDKNDHSPVFEKPAYNVTVSEDIPVGTILTTVHAIDGDVTGSPGFMETKENEIVSSKYGEINYSINGGDGSFSVNPKTGEITLVRPLDREHTDSWTFFVTASDSGREMGRTSTCEVHVVISDVNDNAPLFTNPIKDDSTVFATTKRDDVITRIQAVDYDVGMNAKLRYSILLEDGIRHQPGHMNSTIFMLGSTSGDLRLNKSNPNLNQTLGNHVIVVQVKDSGKPSKKTKRTINVIVTDDVTVPSPKSNGSLMTSSFPLVIVIAALGSGILLLVIVVILVIVKCKKENKKVRTYSCAKRPDELRLKNSLNNIREMETQRRESKDGSVVWSQASSKRLNSMTYESTTDMTNLSRNDVVMSHQFQVDANYDVTIEGGERRNEISSDKKMVANGNLNIPSVRHLSHDGDSGRGDSDPDVISGDVTFDQGYARAKPELIARNRLGPHCSGQCLKLGHSDECWMPISESGTNYTTTTTSSNQQRSLNENISPIRSDYSEHSGTLEPIPELHVTQNYWQNQAPHLRHDLTSIYSNVLPVPYMTSTCGDYIDSHSARDVTSLPKGAVSRRINSTTDSTTTGYVTEPELI